MWSSRLDRKAPGASSEREYRRRMNEWWWDNRNGLAYLLLLPVVSVIALVAIDLTTLTAYLVGFMAGVGVMGSMAALLIPPPAIGRWRRGADGERSTGAELDKLVPLGWTTVHDRALNHANVDHILVGPGGVFAIDSKNWDARIKVIDGTVSRDGFAQPRLARSARRASALINAVIKDSTTTNAWVEPVVVFWSDFPQNYVKADGVSYVSGETLAAWLYSRKTTLKRGQIVEIAAAIAAMPDGVSLGPHAKSASSPY